jgi:hypothetical protein
MPSSSRYTARGAQVSERPRNRGSGGGRRFSRGRRPWPDAPEALTALTRAWTVTTIAAALFLAALAVAPMWDSAIFLHALRDALGRDPQLAQPIDETPADAPVDRAIPRAGAQASRAVPPPQPSVAADANPAEPQAATAPDR